MSASHVVDLLKTCRELYEKDAVAADLECALPRLSEVVLSPGSGERAFIKQHTFNLPPALTTLSNNVERQLRMGFLPEINYVWTAIDNELILVDLVDNRRIIRLELDAYIDCCLIITPAPLTFAVETRYLLAVALTNQIKLYPVTYPKATSTLNNTAVQPPTMSRGAPSIDANVTTKAFLQRKTASFGARLSAAGSSSEETLAATLQQDRFIIAESHLSVALPTDATVTQLVGTQTGRLFAGLTTGSLIEVVYSSQNEGLLSNIGLLSAARGILPGGFSSSSAGVGRARLIDHTSIPVLSHVPFISDLLRPKPIKQAVVDDTRGLLYTLHEDNKITVYAFDDNCISSFRKLKPYTSFQKDLSMYSNDPQTSIVQIWPITLSESVTFNLVAMTDTGLELYYSLSACGVAKDTYTLKNEYYADFIAAMGKQDAKHNQAYDFNYDKLVLKQVRTPFQGIRSLVGSSCISFFRSRGLSVACFFDDVSQQNTVCGSVNEISVQPRVQRCTRELLLDVFVGGQAQVSTTPQPYQQKIVDVVELDSSQAGSLTLSTTYLSSNPQLYQYVHSPRTVAIITTSAIIVYSISTPLERLYAFLRDNIDVSKQKDLYGDQEFYCMLLAIASQHSSSKVSECATQQFFEGITAVSCVQIAALKRYIARLMGPLSIYPYWKGAPVTAPRTYAIQSGESDNKNGAVQRLSTFFSKATQRATNENTIQAEAAYAEKKRPHSVARQQVCIDFSEEGRRAYKEGIINTHSTNRAASTSHISTKSIFRASSTRLSTTTLTKNLSFQASAQGAPLFLDSSHTMASLTWTMDELLSVRERLNQLLRFMQINYNRLIVVDSAQQDTDKVETIFESLGSISEAIGFVSLIIHPSRIIYASTCLNNFARLHGHPMVFSNGHDSAMAIQKNNKRNKQQNTNTLSTSMYDGLSYGIYCDLLSIHGIFLPETRVLLDEIIRTLSVGDVTEIPGASSISRHNHSLLRAASLRYGVSYDFSTQLKEHCQVLHSVYSVRIQVLQQLEQAKRLPPEQRNLIIRRAIDTLVRSQSSIEPIEPILDVLKSMGNFSACIVLLLIRVFDDETALLDALGDDGKLASIKGSLGIHAEQNTGPVQGAYGHKGRTYNLMAPQGNPQSSPELEGSLKDVFNKVLQTNINRAYDYYKGCCHQTVGQGPFARLKELQASIDSGIVKFPFQIDNGFEALVHNELLMSTIPRKDWQASISKVCNLCSKALDILSQGYLLAGIYELLKPQGSIVHGTNGLRDLSGAAFSHFGGYTQFARPTTFTEMTADVESGVHDADGLFALTGVPLRSIHTAASAASGTASGQIVTVLRVAITQCPSKVWQMQLYYFLYAHYYTAACILKALQEDSQCDTSVAVVTVLKIIENRASLGLIMAVSPYIESFLKTQNFYLYFRYLEKRSNDKICVAMFRKATEAKTQAIFPSIVNGTVQLGYLTLQDRINMLSDALAKLESGGLVQPNSAQTAYRTVGNAPLVGAEIQSFGMPGQSSAADATLGVEGTMSAAYPRSIYAATDKGRADDQGVTPQKLLVSIKETLVAARVQLVILRRVQNIKDGDVSKYITQLDTDGIKPLQELYTQCVVPLRLSDIGVYILLSSATPNQERSALGGYWVAALTSPMLPGFVFKQESLLNDPHRGITRGIVRTDSLSSSDLEAANVIGQAAQVFRSIVEMCSDLQLTSFDFIIPMTIFALLTTNRYKTYDPKQQYEKLAGQFILNLFTTDVVTIREKALAANLIHSIDSIWKVLGLHQGGVSTVGNTQIDTAAVMESIPVPDLLKEDFSYVSKVLCYYMIALVRKYSELGSLGYDPSQTSVNKKNIGMRIRAYLPPNAPILAQLDRLCI
ncbi:Hypothetical protein GLP15_4703 [Giardia lamblia P15]|uniref:Nucleoporin Nup133/Nup155-like N-terminal domain-containing protein n=1 Tax=Giardia intestinalis (strain P15) TaxID=658858 RepID=E1F1Q5_GIAIA|nr:Hypothetical protein GLP15_4703 [Giardia lamblia P15]